MSFYHKILFEIVNKKILGKRHEARFRDMRIMNVLDLTEKINMLALMIKHTEKVTDPHGLIYKFLLTKVFRSF